VLEFLPRFWLVDAVDVIDARLCVTTSPQPCQPAVKWSVGRFDPDPRRASHRRIASRSNGTRCVITSLASCSERLSPAWSWLFNVRRGVRLPRRLNPLRRVFGPAPRILRSAKLRNALLNEALLQRLLQWTGVDVIWWSWQYPFASMVGCFHELRQQHGRRVQQKSTACQYTSQTLVKGRQRAGCARWGAYLRSHDPH
jgi:hypothetical protein